MLGVYPTLSGGRFLERGDESGGLFAGVGGQKNVADDGYGVRARRKDFRGARKSNAANGHDGLVRQGAGAANQL
jgi:hypothetical protein